MTIPRFLLSCFWLPEAMKREAGAARLGCSRKALWSYPEDSPHSLVELEAMVSPVEIVTRYPEIAAGAIDRQDIEMTGVDIPNNHLAYAITWFGLALALLAVYLVYHHRQGRLRFE